MEQWLKDHGLLASLVALLLLLWKGKWLWGVVKHLFTASKTIHTLDAQLIAGYEKSEATERSAKEKALKDVANLRIRVVSMADELSLRDDLNKRDRIARLIYLKHLREYDADIESIEREVRDKLETEIYQNGLSHRPD